MRSVAPQAFISLLLNALDAAYNGILLSKQDYTFLLGAMSATLAVLYVYNSWTADAGEYGVWSPAHEAAIGTLQWYAHQCCSASQGMASLASGGGLHSLSACDPSLSCCGTA